MIQQDAKSVETTSDYGFSTDLSSGSSQHWPTAMISEIGHVIPGRTQANLSEAWLSCLMNREASVDM